MVRLTKRAIYELAIPGVRCLGDFPESL